MTSELVYQPLRRDRQEIRLLDIKPAPRPSDPLQCTLRHAKLYDSKFSALSYVWGQQDTDRSEISLKYSFKKSVGQFLKSSRADDSAKPPAVQNVQVGSNLAGALRCMRQNYKNVTIWADALCINQADFEEKSWQVAMMVLIYTQATSVLAWLGPRYGESVAVVNQVNAAFDLANSVWALAQVDKRQSLDIEENWLQVCFALAKPASGSPLEQSNQTQRIRAEFAAALRKSVISAGTLQSGLVAMEAISQLDYFARIWILQETGRARSLTFHYGQRRMSYRPMFLALSLASSLRASQNEPKLQAGPRGFDNRFVRCLVARGTCSQGRSTRDVLELEYFAAPPMHQAGNPRDLIYGRLGLASDPNSIEANYKLSVPQVYALATRYLLTKGFTESLVTFKPYKYSSDIYADSLPSWAHDWSQNCLHSFSKHRASKDTTPLVSFIPHASPKFHEALKITGVNAGQIHSVGTRFSTVVTEAGWSRRAVERGTLRTEPGTVSAEKKQTLIASINRAYQELGAKASNADIERLFTEHSYPLATFWCWWLNWITGLQTLIESAEAQVPTAKSYTSHIGELLFREASRLLSSPPGAQASFGPTLSVAALTDLQRWFKLLFGIGSAAGAQSTRITETGISVADSFFRSAWGMRPAVLDGGRLGYVPEATALRDQVVVFYGVKAPLVLRKAGAGEAFEIVGPAHVCEVMQGQLVDAGLPQRTYVLV